MKKLLLVLMLSGCTLFDPAPPTPFETGEEVFEPQGCFELKTKDPNADC